MAIPPFATIGHIGHQDAVTTRATTSYLTTIGWSGQKGFSYRRSHSPFSVGPFVHRQPAASFVPPPHENYLFNSPDALRNVCIDFVKSEGYVVNRRDLDKKERSAAVEMCAQNRYDTTTVADHYHDGTECFRCLLINAQS